MKHDRSLDGLRGVAIGLVVLYHLKAAPGGWVGVNIFFVLSGYLITSLLLTEQTRTGTIGLPAFYRRRIIRLAPALLVALTIMLLLWSAAGRQGFAVVRTLPALLYVANVAMAFRPGWTITGWAWSLSLEEQFYLCWPLLLRRALRRGVDHDRLVRVLLGACLVPILLRIVYRDDFGLAYALLRGDELMLGACLALTRWTAPRWVAAASLGALGVVILTHSLDHLAWTVTLGTLGAAGLLAGRQTVAPVLNLPPLRYLGRISYALYLWDGVLVSAPLPLAGPHGASPSITAIAVLCAVASTHLLEEPLRRRLGHRDREIVQPHRACVVA